MSSNARRKRRTEMHATKVETATEVATVAMATTISVDHPAHQEVVGGTETIMAVVTLTVVVMKIREAVVAEVIPLVEVAAGTILSQPEAAGVETITAVGNTDELLLDS